MDSFANVEISGKIVAIYQNKNGKSLRLKYQDSHGDSHFLSAHLFNQLEDQAKQDNLGNGDVVNLIGELRSYQKTVGDQNLTQYSVRASAYSLLSKVGAPI
ncbi:MAG: hypothetical protein ACHQ1D_00585 [Nitrososphaerales archaeon]